MLKAKDIMELKASDVMTTNVISVTESTPIYHAVELIAKNNITGVPVVRCDMTLVGVLTEKDVLGLLYEQENELYKTVGDFMTQPAISFDKDTPLLDVCDCLIQNHFRRVPITSSGKLIGIASRRDIIYEHILHIKQQGDDTY